MITTTLNRIREHRPCADGWAKLLAGLGKTRADDEPLPFARIVEINGLDDALWCCRAEPQHAREWRMFAVWCARRALVRTPSPDPRNIAAVDVAERHARGEASNAELAAARATAWAAARAAARDTAWAAAWDTAWATARATAWATAWAAARDTAWDTAWDTARATAWATAWAAARAAARDAAWDTAWDAERDAQRQEFLRVVGGEG